jgi:ribosome-binding ATPase YchF (GTP1/OBG family)
VRDADALIHVVRNFSLFGLSEPSPWSDFQKLDQELILSDLTVAEKKLERMAAEANKVKKPDPEEQALVEECHQLLEGETPLRRNQDLASAHKLRGYAFLSAKPMLVLFNNTDEDDALPASDASCLDEKCMVIRGKLEQELAKMTPDEAAELLAEFDISASATDRVVKQSYALLGLISFFTVGEDEVRAWTIKRGTSALDAAEAIHSDIKKGFIRAEIISCDDFLEAGSMASAKKNGKFRLEGKTYEVQDGDIINFRFNV